VEQQLWDVLRRMTEVRNTVIIIEHNLDGIKAVDWIINLEPDGGDPGGYIVNEGTPEQVALDETGFTSQFLHV
jgi:excinuclease ABC subunit A